MNRSEDHEKKKEGDGMSRSQWSTHFILAYF